MEVCHLCLNWLQWTLRDFRPAPSPVDGIIPPGLTFDELFHGRLPSIQRPRIAHARFGGSQFNADRKMLATTGQYGMILLECTIDNWFNDQYFQSQPGLYDQTERMYVFSSSSSGHQTLGST